jgi:hypothetical protein
MIIEALMKGKMPIAKTAPSRTRGADKLLDEIKQILG